MIVYSEKEDRIIDTDYWDGEDEENMEKKYKLVELFKSIQGEGYNFGKECIFIRFCGCNLNCPWCDTSVNNCTLELTAKEIKEEVDKLGCKNIILTGGEPTIQDLDTLLKEFDKNYWIGIETNGLREVPERINWVSCSPKFHFRNIELKLQNPLIYRHNRFNNPMFKEGEFRLVVDNDSDEFIDWAINLQKKYDEYQTNLRWYLSPCAKNDWVIGKSPEFDWDKLAKVYEVLKTKGFKISIQVHKLWGKR